jgi:L-amino acid N-acyltransferase YncA
MGKVGCSHFVRPAKMGDIDSCVKLSEASWPEWWAGNYDLGEKHIRECVQAGRCLVAEDGEKVVAFIVWGTLWNKVHLQDIFVVDGLRGSGIGTSLVQEVEKIARSQGFKEIVSDCDTINRESIDFHIANGFEVSGLIEKNWDDDDSVTFSKKIAKTK